MPLEDVYEQVTLTALVRRNINEEAAASDGGEDRAFYGQQIAPQRPIQSRRVKLRISDVTPYGLGQFKAPNAVPPFTKFKPKLTEQIVELALLEERERIDAEEWMKLDSGDDAIARGAKLSLVQRMTYLQRRNEALTEWMRWSAFKGSLLVTYPGGSQMLIDYGFAGSHLPTAGVLWTDLVNSDPLADLYAWSAVGSDDAGQYFQNVHVNTMTWRLVQYNTKLKNYLSPLGRPILLPRMEDVAELMRPGTSNWHIIDEGYLPENATNRRLTKFLPDNRVLLTTSYNLRGQAIAETLDGQVLVGGGPNQAPTISQGMQSEVGTDWASKNVIRRQASARMVALWYPEAFLYATVGA